MTFEDFLHYRLREQLPGRNAHREFVPDIPDAKARLSGIPEGARRSAVLVPLITRPHTFPDVLFTVRSESLRTHKGQISFPGGRVDENEDDVDAALRELEEEVGISRNIVRVIGSLTEIFIPPSNSSVIPIVAFIDNLGDYAINTHEVSEVLIEPLMHFINPDSLISERRKLYNTDVDVPLWRIHPSVPLWGATAMILNELVHISREFIDQK